MQDALVQVARDGALLQLTLNRPERLNALNHGLLHELQRQLETAAADPGVGLLVLRGAGGRAFCGGADTDEMLGGDKARAEQIAGLLEDVLYRIVHFPCPVLAVIHGHALGGGAYLAAACDLRIAVPEARFHFAATSYGLVLGAWFLPRMVGPLVARDLMMTARVFPAEEALQLGLVQRLVPREQLEAATQELIGQLLANQSEALRLCKQLLSGDGDPAEVRRLELEHNVRQAGTPDFCTRLAAAVAGRGKNKW